MEMYNVRIRFAHIKVPIFKKKYSTKIKKKLLSHCDVNFISKLRLAVEKFVVLMTSLCIQMLFEIF